MSSFHMSHILTFSIHLSISVVYHYFIIISITIRIAISTRIVITKTLIPILLHCFVNVPYSLLRSKSVLCILFFLFFFLLLTPKYLSYEPKCFKMLLVFPFAFYFCFQCRKKSEKNIDNEQCQSKGKR